MSRWVYILEGEAKSCFYVGSCADVDERLSEHQAGKVASTKAYRPWVVVFREEHPTRAAAVRRERQIKGMKSRVWIEKHLLGRIEK